MKKVKIDYLFAVVIFISCGQSTLLAQISEGRNKFLGNVIWRTIPDDYGRHWNQVTPENAGKWGSVERKRDRMLWKNLDLAYDHARKNNYPFKQHTLIWGQQQPKWIKTLSAAEQRGEVEEWIKSFCERFPETDYIDVVNEPLHAVPSYAEALGGKGTTEWDWVIWSFQKARQYCPNAKLVLNDYNILSSDSATAVYLGIINVLKSRALIDVVGEQGHFLETTPTATIQRNLDRLASAGLPIHISEYDVDLVDDALQLEKFREQIPIFWNHPSVRGMTLWGYREGHIWRKNAYLLRADGSERPAFTWLTEFVKRSKTQP